MLTELEFQFREAFHPLRQMPASHGPAINRRIPAFDFTKGTLVLFMVLYHWLNYFYGSQGDIYRYLRFLTPSFIFVSGFLISHVNLVKYGAGSVALSERLFMRGLKLLGVFLALNIFISPLAPGSFIRGVFSGHSPLAQLDAVFFTARIAGSDGGKIASFGILVAISYLLMLAALLSVACRFFKYAFHAAFVLLLLCMVFLDFKGIESANLELITVGVLGVILGYIPEERLQNVLRRRWAIVSTYLLYLVMITFLGVSLYVQMVGACLTTALIYTVGASVNPSRQLASHIQLLGRYSLFGYISQIAILQLLSLSLRRIPGIPGGYAILGASFVAAVTLTMASVIGVDKGRSKSKTLDGLYRAVFA